MLNLYKKIKTSEQGSVVVFVAIMLPIFMLCMLLAIDASKAAASNIKTSYIQDSVGFSYANVTDEMLKANNISREDYALRFVKLNLPEAFMGVQHQFNIAADENYVVTSSQASRPSGGGSNLNFAGAAGISQQEMAAGKSSKIELNSSSSATTSPTLLSLVLDGSGSMKGQKIIDLKTSVKNLVDSALKNNSDKDFWISQAVYGKNTKTDRDFSNSYLTVLNWGSDIKSKGGTCGACGLQDAVDRMDAKIKSDVKYASYNKVVVFMTDGIMTAGDKKLPQCDTLKDAGYTVYGIFFGMNAKGEAKVENCASPGKYYRAATSSELNEVFNSIITRIVRVRLVE